MPNNHLDVDADKFETQYIDELKNTLCEKSQSVFFLYFFACKSEIKGIELT